MIEINDLIGNFGKYHWWLCVLIFFNKFGVAFHQIAIIFLAPPVMYSCPGTNKSCCDSPTYDRSLFKNTIIMEWHLICDRCWMKDFTQTIFMFGVLIGSLLLGIASDRFGRKIVLIASVVCEVLFGVLASFMPDFWAFTMTRMLLGFSVGGVMVVGFVVVMEFVGSKHRDVVSALYQMPFTVGHMMLPLFSYYFDDYRYFQLAISLSCSILLVYICLLPETPRWLLAMTKIEQAIQTIKTVAKINNLPTENIEEKIALYQKQQTLTAKRGTVLDLFRTPNLRKNILIMSFQWLVCSYCFYGLSQYISKLSGDIFINVVLNGALTTLGVILSIPMMKFLGRKTVVILSNAACGSCLLLIACLEEGLVSVVLGCVGALFSFVVFVLVYLYSTELFPTTVRNAAMGICSMMARLGAMFAPFTADLGNYGHWCPPLGFGIPPIAAAILCFLMPETKNCPLMTTIEEGEAFGKRVQPQTSSSPEPALTMTSS